MVQGIYRQACRIVVMIRSSEANPRRAQTRASRCRLPALRAVRSAPGGFVEPLVPFVRGSNSRRDLSDGDGTGRLKLLDRLVAERVGLTRAILALAPSGRAARVQFGCPAELSNPRIPVKI
jgi:hypothetical protein